ncbi:hypothetical protein BDR26DRAFT_826645 [Obelidium mucronatum]|nr:hypothetical protein BDR26DRAFT_826645 [Obelidium mucronatum]
MTLLTLFLLRVSSAGPTSLHPIPLNWHLHVQNLPRSASSTFPLCKSSNPTENPKHLLQLKSNCIADSHHQRLHRPNCKPFITQSPRPLTKKRHACTWEGCSKSFSKPNLLQTHLNIHNQIKPHKCIACPSEFARKHDLLRHSRHVHQLNL